jgi:hypothetical protein
LQPVARRIRENAASVVTDEQIANIRRALVRYAAAADLAHFRPIAYPNSDKPRGGWLTLGESLTRSRDRAQPRRGRRYGGGHARRARFKLLAGDARCCDHDWVSATFVAGALGAVGLIRGLNNVGSVYGVACFALLFSFVGTILGGIWADQSWGRFWGWDPKENGALLIVLWNAVLLHLHWGRLVGDRALMAGAVFGNVITSFSWFGLNMLGVGLHSYGFMDGAPFWLGTFVLSQLAIMTLAFVPSRQIQSTANAA